MIALKDCPFCGCPAMFTGGGSARLGQLPSRIECSSRLCMVATPPRIDRNALAEIWNRRLRTRTYEYSW